MASGILASMLSRDRSIKTLFLGLLVCGLLSAPAQALSLRVSADRVSQGPVDASGLRLSLIAPDQPGAGLGLQLQVDSLDIAGSGYSFRALDWRCELRPRDVATWHCAGPLRSSAGAAGELALDWRNGDSELTLVRGRARLAAGIPGGAAPLTLQAERLPAEWLQPLLGALWTSARFTGGTLAADLEMDFALSPPRLEGSLRADGLGLDTADGLIAAADLNLQGRLGLELGEQTRIATELALSGGEILLGCRRSRCSSSWARLVQVRSGHWSDCSGTIPACSAWRPRRASTRRQRNPCRIFGWTCAARAPMY